MPDREESDSPRVLAGRAPQLSSLARLAIVVGVPFASAFLRVPLWVTVLLLFGLAGALFVVPHLPRKSTPDPKQAWMRLMASFVSLQSTYKDLQKSPADAAALKKFSTFEGRCLSLLAERADSGWGADTDYAAKIGNEIAAMSADVRTGCSNAASTPGQQRTPPAEPVSQASESAHPGVAAKTDKTDGLAPSVRPEVLTSDGLLDLILARESAAARSDGPMSPQRPDAPAPAEEQGLTLADLDAIVMPASDPLESAEDEVTAPVAELVLVGVSQDAAAQSTNAAPASNDEDQIQTLEQYLVSIGMIAAERSEISAPVARAEATIQEVKQVLPVANAGTSCQTCGPGPSTTFGAPAPAEVQSLALASAVTNVQVDNSPRLPAGPEVTTPAERNPAPASEVADAQPVSPAIDAKPDAVGLTAKRLTPYVWLPGGVEDAAAFYLSVFKNSLVAGMNRYPEGVSSAAGGAASATIRLDGQELILLNGGPAYNLSEASSLLVRCVDQAEVDYYWQRLLSGGGKESTCGWLKDRFGVSWQVVPDALLELINDPNPQRAARATEAMLKMKKIDIAALREAAGQPELVAA
jgi:predicted 3-demethylubiquinone-9 3-methyltransferase (glyoxalase superfamily)